MILTMLYQALIHAKFISASVLLLLIRFRKFSFYTQNSGTELRFLLVYSSIHIQVSIITTVDNSLDFLRQFKDFSEHF